MASLPGPITELIAALMHLPGIGRRSAEAMLERHFQEHGRYPAAMGLSVWGTSVIVGNADRTDPYLVAKETLTPGTVIDEDNVLIGDIIYGSTIESVPQAMAATVITIRLRLIPAVRRKSLRISGSRPAYLRAPASRKPSGAA